MHNQITFTCEIEEGVFVLKVIWIERQDVHQHHQMS